MYSPTKWEAFKDFVRALFCRHKHTEVRTVKVGRGGERTILGKFRYCFDCRNNISGWL